MRLSATIAVVVLSGALNVLGDYDGYRPINAEALIEEAPDVLLVVQHDTDKDQGAVVQSVLNLPGVALTPAGRHARIIVLDALRFLGFGPRTGEALQDLAGMLYPVPDAQ